MADFEVAYKKVMKYEGKYSNDSVDLGGETYKGIARKFHPNWPGWKIIDGYKNDPLIKAGRMFPGCLDKDSELQGLVHLFFKERFWDIWMGDAFVQGIADEMFDIAVNLNYTKAIKFLQIIMNCLNNNQEYYEDLVVDGVFGIKTFETMQKVVNRNESALIIKMLNVLQGSHYIEFMKASPLQEKYARGWFSRVDISKN